MTLRNRPLVLTCLLVVSGLLLSSGAQAALQGRLALTPGGTYQAAYDDVLDITWLTNAGLSGVNSWDNQVAWADNLNTLGFDDWRLATISATSPTTSVFDCSSGTAADCATAGNELGYMYYHNMDGSGDNRGTQVVDGISLTNVQNFYWSDTEFGSSDAWDFNFGSGDQNFFVKANNLEGWGWAVRSGDVGVVPIPAAAWLFGSAIGLLGWKARKAA